MMSRKRILTIAMAVLPLVAACADAPAPATTAAVAAPASIRVPLQARGGTHTIPVGIAGYDFPFVVDSGAADVSVSAELFQAMVADGLITKADLIDVVNYQTANGVVAGLRFRCPPLTVGGRTVYGVICSTHRGATMLLLGQSFMQKFRAWAIDNATGELVLTAEAAR